MKYITEEEAIKRDIQNNWENCRLEQYKGINTPHKYRCRICNKIFETEPKYIWKKKYSCGCIFNKKNVYNTKFFDKINPISCYWAGFIAADGHIKPIKNSISHNLTMGLAREDKNHLRKFVDCVEFTGKITDYESSPSEEKKKKYNCKDKYYGSKVEICGIQRDWLKSLENIFNIHHNKSLTLEPPFLDKKEYIIPFIKGYLDGDGWLYVDKRNRLVLGFCGTRNILNFIKSKFSEYISNLCGGRLVPSGKIFEITYLCNQAIKIGDLLKDKPPIGLDRKWNAFYSYINQKIEVKNENASN